MKLKNIDVEKVASAVEADAGQALAGLRESLAQAKCGEFGATHTLESIVARKRGRPVGSTKPDAKQAIKLRLDPEVLSRWRASGPGWQTRMAEVLGKAL